MLRADAVNLMNGIRVGNQLQQIRRCPHCSISNPTLNRV